MPHLIVKIAEGRTSAIKQALANRLTETVMDVLALDAGSVSVAVEEVAPDEWMRKIYGPDIEAAADRLLKRPGYGPLATSAEG